MRFDGSDAEVFFPGVGGLQFFENAIELLACFIELEGSLVLLRHKKGDIHRKSFACINFGFIDTYREESIVCDFHKFWELIASAKKIREGIVGISSPCGIASGCIGHRNSLAWRGIGFSIDGNRKFPKGKLSFFCGFVVLNDAVGATHLTIDDIRGRRLRNALFLKSRYFWKLVVGLYFFVGQGDFDGESLVDSNLIGSKVHFNFLPKCFLSC